MTESSYREIMNRLDEEYHSCKFKWDCGNCDKTLCLRIIAIADFPTKYGHFTVIGFLNNKDRKDHIVVAKGDVVQGESVVTRLHSSCVTGDVLGSLRCDCGPQLRKSLQMIEKEGLGLLLYMQQEGRGIGLTNKIRAYMLQDAGSDTYEANIDLGFKPDERQYELAAAMLSELGVRSIRLLTNNPDKIRELESFGVAIKERIPLETRPNKYNRAYLQAKKNRFGHLFRLDSAHKKP